MADIINLDDYREPADKVHIYVSGDSDYDGSATDYELTVQKDINRELSGILSQLSDAGRVNVEEDDD